MLTPRNDIRHSYTINIEHIDPDHTVYAQCPLPHCKTIIFSCCKEHLKDPFLEHIKEAH